MSTCRDRRAAVASSFDQELKDLLEKGGFEAISQAQLQAALAGTGLVNGLRVIVPPPGSIHYQVYYRGVRQQEVQFRSWRTYFMTKETQVPVYQRLAISFRTPDGDSMHVIPEEDEQLSWYRKLLRGGVFRTKVVKKVAATKVHSNWTYLKLFKDIDVNDVDMLLPGSVVKFSHFDYIMIWGPILFGLGSAIYKACQGTLDFHDMTATLTSLLLVLLPLTWGMRAYMAVKDKQRAYEAHMNKLFLLHNLNNNAGVISACMDEAREQEDNEALLAYFFAWYGQHQPQPVEQSQLDRAVEAYINKLVAQAMNDRLLGAKDESVGNPHPAKGSCQIQPTDGTCDVTSAGSGVIVPAVPKIDFEVTDAVSKLSALGVMQQVTDPMTGKACLKAATLPEALELSHISNIKEADLSSSQPLMPKADSGTSCSSPALGVTATPPGPAGWDNAGQSSRVQSPAQLGWPATTDSPSPTAGWGAQQMQQHNQQYASPPPMPTGDVPSTAVQRHLAPIVSDGAGLGLSGRSSPAAPAQHISPGLSPQNETPEPEWQECFEMYPGAAQQVRYFYNTRTGYSTYEEPRSYRAAAA
eukprot:GHRR01032807.1.p1 GENE.GHRR01032807.1~~GHRR01032807.1.p1  ORF type:complete len:582 (+),score=192.67 GHRR01032807.1:378-2123(+)